VIPRGVVGHEYTGALNGTVPDCPNPTFPSSGLSWRLLRSGLRLGRACSHAANAANVFRRPTLRGIGKQTL
jgi:hypothetical protein